MVEINVRSQADGLQGLLVRLAGVWTYVTCPGARVYNPDGRRSHLVRQLELTAINCPGVCPDIF